MQSPGERTVIAKCAAFACKLFLTGAILEFAGLLSGEAKFRPYQSEIRDNTIRDLLLKVKQLKYGLYLKKVKLTKVRAFSNETVDFDFPVTALIGTNGGGKSTILGAAAIAHKSMRPALFFPKSFIGDETMSEWSIGYEIVHKSNSPHQLIQRSARFKRSKWVRDDLIDRPVLYFGIQRTVPAGERREFKKLATVNYKFWEQGMNSARQFKNRSQRFWGRTYQSSNMRRYPQTKPFTWEGMAQSRTQNFILGRVNLRS